jgi:hypothetical protein
MEAGLGFPRRPLPDDVALARQEFERANEKNRTILEPRIELHLASYDAALTELETAHRLVATRQRSSSTPKRARRPCGC